MRVLGIDVDFRLVERWRAWLMPRVQPFQVPRCLADQHGWTDDRARLTLEVVDAFGLYDVRGTDALVWLSRREAARLPPEVRERQPAPHRWPAADEDRNRSTVLRYVERGRRTSRHHEVDGKQWAAAADVLPGARGQAGTFALRSGPNCFGTVMAAAGLAGAADEWMQVAPFEDWLSAATRAGGDDRMPGTVLVRRGRDGRPAHAAVTLGGGWLLQKASQGWMSPRQVLDVRQGKYSARFPGLRLHRRRILP